MSYLLFLLVHNQFSPKPLIKETILSVLCVHDPFIEYQPKITGKVYLCCLFLQAFFLFSGCVIFYLIDSPYFLYHLSNGSCCFCYCDNACKCGRIVLSLLLDGSPEMDC